MLHMVLYTILVVLVLYLSRQIADLRVLIADLLTEYEYEEEEADYSDVELSSQEELAWEEMLAKRNQAFDERIARIKHELDKEMPPRKSPNDAEVLASGVYNLPHDSIRDYETNPPDVEYTE